MIEHEARQGTEEWLCARLGLPTASQFDQVITPATLKPSKQATGYMHKLLAEWATGCPEDVAQSQFMDRGTEMEPEAAGWYELNQGVDTRQVGLCMTDDKKLGCSPDRLVGDNGGLEIKCPAARTHIKYLMGADPYSQYRHQVQGCLLVTGRKWWDLLVYNPALPPLVFRYVPEPDYQDALIHALAVFVEEMEKRKKSLRAAGVRAVGDRMQWR